MTKEINVRKSLFTNTSSIISVIKTIEIIDDGADNASGGYGTIYRCATLDNNPSPNAMVIKLFHANDDNARRAGYRTIARLQKRMNEWLVKQVDPYYNAVTDIPALRAFPIFSFEGMMEGKEVLGYGALDLRDQGFVPLSEVVEEFDHPRELYSQLSYSERFRFCFYIAQGFSILDELQYVHADINPVNIFVNIDTQELSLIDFDGGAILDSPHERTLACGKLQDGEWIAPELYEKLERNEETFPDKYSDRWSLATLFHMLIFLQVPFFFLNEASKTCKEIYLSRNPLFPINTHDELIANIDSMAFTYYEAQVTRHIPVTIHTEMINTFEKGFATPRNRTSSAHWLTLFRQTQPLPSIEEFMSDKLLTFKNIPVMLSWNVKNAVKIAIDQGVGPISAIDHIQVLLNITSTYTLIAVNPFGRDQRIVRVECVPFPELKFIEVPFPKLTSTLVIDISTPFSRKSAHTAPITKSSIKFPGIPLMRLPNGRTLLRSLYRPLDTSWNIAQVMNYVKQCIKQTTMP